MPPIYWTRQIFVGYSDAKIPIIADKLILFGTNFHKFKRSGKVRGKRIGLCLMETRFAQKCPVVKLYNLFPRLSNNVCADKGLDKSLNYL